jgi:hypothetical protein
VTYNKQLRSQIDNLRRERMMFEAINAQLDRDLARIKRDIADVIKVGAAVGVLPWGMRSVQRAALEHHKP